MGPDGRRAHAGAHHRPAADAVGARSAGRRWGRSETLPNTSDWYGRFRAVANKNNDYLIDREKQKTESYTGIDGIFLQDQAVTESMGADLRPHPGAPRHQRHDGHPHAQARSSTRRGRCATAARCRPAWTSPEVYAIRSGGVVLPSTAKWLEATAELTEGLGQAPRAHP